ncbi:MAG: hypothetical protein Q4A15_07865, partial [Prevotellaceae bacterium]|nr:hypothetical protein [Prevotellaceae bacterium]
VGTLCYGYIERLFVPIVGAGSPAYSVTFKVTMIGCLVGCLAMVNLIMTISLQGRKKKNP